MEILSNMLNVLARFSHLAYTVIRVLTIMAGKSGCCVDDNGWEEWMLYLLREVWSWRE